MSLLISQRDITFSNIEFVLQKTSIFAEKYIVKQSVITLNFRGARKLITLTYKFDILIKLGP